MSRIWRLGHVLGLYVLTLWASLSPLETAAQSLYAPWPNGPPQRPDFFPISVWWQSPNLQGRSGPYLNGATAAVAEHINIFFGLGGVTGAVDTWPEAYGQDTGELEAVQANGLYAIGGIFTPYTQNTDANSVASILALANSIGASSNLIGYNAGDEPQCGASMDLVPTVVQGINTFDPTRVVLFNQLPWMMAPQNSRCLNSSIAALQATGVVSTDLFPVTNAWWAGSQRFGGSDFLAVPSDGLFEQGLATQAIRYFAGPNQPVWMAVESGSDSLGLAEANNVFRASFTSGEKIITNSSGWSKFTTSWIGLTISGAGIPPNATITRVLNSIHAVLSVAPTESSAGEWVHITGGVLDSDCVASVNLCVANGNEYRATPAEVNAEVWMSIINGANGLNYFCHDSTTASFCLGDNRGGPAAAIVQSNLTYVNSTVLSYAPVLNSPTVGICSMQGTDYPTGAVFTTISCSDRLLTMATADAQVPGMALVKQLGGVTYLFAQSGRRSKYGAVFSFTLSGLAGQTATVVYDSNQQYDPDNSSVGRSATLNGSGRFSDSIGTQGNSYEVKIYTIK